MSSFQHPSPLSGQKGALRYHHYPVVGKYTTKPTKSLKTFLDLSLAYTPFVAKVCQDIAQESTLHDQRKVSSHYCLHPVAVISNGTAVLGLGDIGAFGSKPVMEGKAVLFQSLGHVPCVDLEIQEKDPQKFVDTIKSLAPSFGAINLEDIKAPECFFIEKELQDIGIPVFHDDQHGTAIVVAAALLNALLLTGRTIDKVKTVVAGAGAGAIACLQLLESFGLQQENIYVCDSKGLLTHQRSDYDQLSPEKKYYSQHSSLETLEEALRGADFFLGLSAGGKSLPASWVDTMNPKAIVFALANPTPEFWPQEVLERRADILMSTGRSDFPNQVNNAICFPYLFRGALDAGAKKITLAMKKACALALAEVPRYGYGDWEETWAFASHHHISLLHGLCPEDKHYDAQSNQGTEGQQNNVSTPQDVQEIIKNMPLWMDFGPSYFMPKVFDPRLLWRLPEAVFRAAQECSESGAPKDRLCPAYEELAFQDYPFLRLVKFALSKETSTEENPAVVLCCSEELYQYPWFYERLEAMKGFFKSQGLTLHLQQEQEGAHGCLVSSLEEYTEQQGKPYGLGFSFSPQEEKIHQENYGQHYILRLITTQQDCPLQEEFLHKALEQRCFSEISPRLFSKVEKKIVAQETMDSLETLGSWWTEPLFFSQQHSLLSLEDNKSLKQWIESLCWGFLLSKKK